MVGETLYIFLRSFKEKILQIKGKRVSEKGSHTWDIIIEYHRCPNCEFINENRKKYQYRLGKQQKEVECQRCHHLFVVTKKVPTPKLKPIFADADTVEIDWDERK